MRITTTDETESNGAHWLHILLQNVSAMQHEDLFLDNSKKNTYYLCSQWLLVLIGWLLAIQSIQHALQLPSLSFRYPGLHIHPVSLSLPLAESVFSGHSWHTSDVSPTVIEYLPAIQSVHTAVPAELEYFPATHCEHSGLPVKSFVCVPAEQSIQSVGNERASSPFVDFPAAHT